MFSCGSGSFSDDDNDKEAYGGSPCPTPKRWKRSTSFCPKHKDTNKNPYAKRGLDKFYALLADLDSKKQKIYTQKGAEDISFVRFVYTSDSDRVKPIVVKVKEKTDSLVVKKSMKKNPSNLSQAQAEDKSSAAAELPKKEEEIVRRKKRRCVRCRESLKLMRQPYFYFPVVVLLVLMFLAMYGRSFAILCTSIGWYMVPTVTGGGGTSSSSPSSSLASSSSSSPPNINERKPKRKKEYARKPSDQRIVHSDEGPSSPKSVLLQIK